MFEMVEAFWWAPIAAAGVSGALSFFGARDQNAASARAAREQMAFQERMANTRYQRTVADMRAARLNPILAAKQGGGPVPGGASYAPVNVAGQAGNIVGQGVSSALQARRLSQELENLEVTNEVLQSTRDKTEAEAISAAANSARDVADQQFYETPEGQELHYWRRVGESLGLSGAGLIGYIAGRVSGGKALSAIGLSGGKTKPGLDPSLKVPRGKKVPEITIKPRRRGRTDPGTGGAGAVSPRRSSIPGTSPAGARPVKGGTFPGEGRLVPRSGARPPRGDKRPNYWSKFWNPYGLSRVKWRLEMKKAGHKL